MLDRRDFILASLLSALLPAGVKAGMPGRQTLAWQDFEAKMRQLAAARADRTVTQPALAARGVHLLQQLDAADGAFQAAIESSYESGNRFWLWQRLAKESGVMGGILTVERSRDVPLHDHPGATGMLRVLEGELEVWQFDRPAGGPSAAAADRVVLERVVHRVLRPGDIAVLSPGSANIHALRARSAQCSMLDYFIPPYVRSERTWYEPVDSSWHGAERVDCRCVPESDFYMS